MLSRDDFVFLDPDEIWLVIVPNPLGQSSISSEGDCVPIVVGLPPS